MRRWNGWGDENIQYPLHTDALAYLERTLGPRQRLQDVPFSQIVQRVPASNLPAHPLIRSEAEERVRHARGQSLPDWIALRHGTLERFPDGVAFPENDEQVRELIGFAVKHQCAIIPYGGGTSVVGHINPPLGSRATLTVDMQRMHKLLSLDETSHLATFAAGVSGAALEAQLRPKGYILGHFPQSFEYSTLGGWIATRSCGQQSYYYGRIEDMLAGAHIETPSGSLELPALPASAAGPDLRQVLLGCEGRLGIITRATVRVRRVPQIEAFYGVFFPSWEAGVNALRQIAQQGVGISMARLSDPQETDTTLILAGKPALTTWGRRGLSILGFGAETSLLVFGVTGGEKETRQAKQHTLHICRQNEGLFTGRFIGHAWEKNRFLAPYLRNTLWELGYAVDTLETAIPWSQLLAATNAIRISLQNQMEQENERILVMTHISHIYNDGASIYVTFIFRRNQEAGATRASWQAMKSAASEAICVHGGTISHQHGVGVDHAPYLHHEKGPLGNQLIAAMISAVDPMVLMNPGKLLPLLGTEQE